MKRRTDALAQQARIRAEYEARKAQIDTETTKDEWLRLRSATEAIKEYGEPVEGYTRPIIYTTDR